MTNDSNLMDQETFTSNLYQKMQQINPGIADLEPLEFRYALESIAPSEGWKSIALPACEEIERKLNDINFYESIELKPVKDGRPVWDDQVLNMTRALFAGLVENKYSFEWINRRFDFDIRGFYFIPHTEYTSPKIEAHLGGKPWKKFTSQRHTFDHMQAIGYKSFKAANAEVDGCFIDLMHRLVAQKGVPCVIAIAGQTAAGKTEIVARLRESFEQAGHDVTSIELDNFLTDRDYREEHGIDSRGKDAFHFEIFRKALYEICEGNPIMIPHYDFLSATSSHDLHGVLKPGRSMIEIHPAEVIFMEGNFPFLIPEIAQMIQIKVVYLTSDEIRLKRKWKRDMDLRKKYDLHYFLNRYFREQFIMAEQVYRPQLELCDVYVDTSNAAIWVTPEIQKEIEIEKPG